MSVSARTALVLAAAAAALVLAGCRQDMHDQPRYEPLEASPLFADGAASRTPPAGTVARGQLREDRRFYTGLDAGGDFLTELPLALDRELLERGRSRYEAFCAPCHDRVGNGHGMIVRRGYKQPASFHEARLREAGVGYFYTVMTNGFGQMSSYAAQIRPRDRWAIAAYVKALQLSQGAPRERLSEADLREMPAPAEPAAPGDDG